MSYSSTYRARVQALHAPESPLVLVEVMHATLTEPLRFVGDNQPITSNGHLYYAAAFGVQWPDDQNGQLPRGGLTISNVDGAFSGFLERTGGAKGVTITLLQVLRSNPDFIEQRLPLDLTNISCDADRLTGQLGLDNLLNLVGTNYLYRPETAPGLF